mmetsp:Transcript_110138/g.322245  ORF Transcript_110138/g.322245 Transcript_110138/m.322245 type:complete len:94 (-) Transcript_110138:1314-1595(-)
MRSASPEESLQVRAIAIKDHRAKVTGLRCFTAAQQALCCTFEERRADFASLGPQSVDLGSSKRVIGTRKGCSSLPKEPFLHEVGCYVSSLQRQ